MTYSIVALDRETGDLGVGVQTHQPSVGAIVPWVSPGVGAVATQAMANIDLGPRSLALMERGLDAEHALGAVLAADSGAAIRQLGVVDASGTAVAHTVDDTLHYAEHHVGDGFCAQANMMLSSGVPAAMAAAFEATASEHSAGLLAERILTALEAGEAAGGDIRGMQSAAILVRPADASHVEYHWDLRVDNDPAPLVALRGLLHLRLADRIIDAAEAAAKAARDAGTPTAELLSSANKAFSNAEALYSSDEQTF
ncbi:MAG TPA: DUF1028 domain-containing protein [Dehalococcoidia bacterium]|nr:DUF1028 domain-containing protein [Dehalococcoidia bacterium]